MSTASLSSLTSPSLGSWRARNWTWAAAAGMVGMLAYGPLVGMFVRQQWEKPHYQFFPFVIGAFAWLLWRRTTDAPRRTLPSDAGRWLDGGLLAAAVGLLLAAIALRSPWGAVVSLILLAGYACRVISQTRHTPNLLGVWLLMWLVVPLPFGLDARLTSVLQGASSKISSFVLDVFGVEHVMEGNTLWLSAGRLFVDEACSGIVSVLSVLACAVVFAVVKRRTPLHGSLLAASGVFWATIVNVARITTIAVALDRWGVDWSTGTAHEMLSLTLFFITLLALLSTDRILQVCLEPVTIAWRESVGGELRSGATLAAAWDSLVTWRGPATFVADSADSPALESAATTRARRHRWSWAPVVLFAPLAVLQSALFVQALRVSPGYAAAVSQANAANADSLPAVLAGLPRTDFSATERDQQSIHGMYSRTYSYVGDDATYFISLDFPFSGGWHELSECYQALGWEPVERRIVAPPGDAGQESWAYVEAEFFKPSAGYGAVAFAEYDQYGDPLSPHDGWRRPQESYFRVRNFYLEDRKTFQVQAWVTSAAPVTADQRRRAAELLLDARERFRKLVIAPSGVPVQGASQILH